MKDGLLEEDFDLKVLFLRSKEEYFNNQDNN